MGYCLYYKLGDDELKEPSEFIGCIMVAREEDGLFTLYKDGTVSAKLHNYAIYPSEQLPPDCVEWSWRKVASLIWRKAIYSGPWMGRYIRFKRWIHFKLTGKYHLPSEERFLERFVLSVMKETHPNLYARISEWKKD